MVSSKELVKRAIAFNDPERIPVSYPYDLQVSDIINVDVVHNFEGEDKLQSEWGFRWSRLENELQMGQPEKPLLKTWDDLKRYKAPDPFRPDRFEKMVQTQSIYGSDKYYKANFVLSGFTIMTFLRGFSELMEDFYLEREHVEELADIVFGFEEKVIRQLKPMGFDAVGLADDWGTQNSLFISPGLWRDIFKPRYKKQIELSHECGLDVYFHCCGYIYDIIPDFVEMGLDILNPGQPDINNISRMGEDFSGKICFACPVSYQTTGISGTREEIKNEIEKMVKHLGNNRGGLIGLVASDIIHLGGSIENVQLIYDLFKTGYLN